MLANAELAQDFALLNQQFKELVEGLVDVVNIPPIRVEVGTTPAGNFRGFDAGKFYVVDSGSITARYQGRAIFILEQREGVPTIVHRDYRVDSVSVWGCNRSGVQASFDIACACVVRVGKRLDVDVGHPV